MKKLALALLVGLSFSVLPQQVSANEIPPSLTYESLDKTTIRLSVQSSDSSREHRICPSILNKQNPDGSWSCHEALKLYPGQLTYDYKLSYGVQESFTVISHDLLTKQWSGWSNWHYFTNTNPNEPIVVLPTTQVLPSGQLDFSDIIKQYEDNLRAFEAVFAKTLKQQAKRRAKQYPYSVWANNFNFKGYPWPSLNSSRYSASASIFPISSGFSSKCVGVCWGVPSAVNGLPRNTYVSGYYRSDGTWVNPYTRSKP